MTDYEALEGRLVWSSMNIVRSSDGLYYQVLDSEGRSLVTLASMPEAIAWARGWIDRDAER